MTKPSPPPVLTVHSNPKLLLPLLHRHLPRTIVIYRRLQYHINHPSAYANRHGKVISVFPADVNLLQKKKAEEANETENAEDSSHHRTRPWLVTHIDVSRLTETTCYLFSSVELLLLPSSSTSSTGVETSAASPAHYDEASAQLDAFFAYVRDVLVPADRPTTAPPGWPFTKQMPGAEKAYRRSVVLLGAVGEPVLALLREMESGASSSSSSTTTITLSDATAAAAPATSEGQSNYNTKRETVQLRIVRCDFPYAKYIFPGDVYEQEDSSHGHSVSESTMVSRPPHNRQCSSSSVVLPDDESLVFGTLSRTDEFELVIARTHIPRTVQMLSSVPNLGIYVRSSSPNESAQGQGQGQGPSQGPGSDRNAEEKENQRMPIAWSFLGYDASLSSLHVEPEYRGRGLAQVLAKRLFAEAETFYNAGLGGENDGEGWKRGLGTVDWAHADVLETNLGSRRVMEKLGGGKEKIAWRVAWTEVDVGEAMG